MRIKRLRLAGFKSFVDPADLRIEPGLTGVVGPNGCGKSNLLEALRWAMGEGSAKAMRGAGMDDVIFAGTATRPARDFAEVSILAEDAGADGGETEIVRRIERGGGSAYRIDGRDVRARDVALLFADSATGAHSPALVSQGRIGAIIAARPAERRAMLEEAAGIAGLHVRRKEAEARLRATEANLVRFDETIADAEARADALRRQARAAERYRALSATIRVAEARMIFARWRDAAAAADAATAEAKAAEALVAERAAAGALADVAQADAIERLVVARAAALGARDRASEAAHRLEGLRDEAARVGRRLGELGEARRRLAEDRSREVTLAADAAEALARLAREAAALEAAIADGAVRLPTLDAALSAAESAGRDAEVALAQALAAQATEAAEARVAGAALTAAIVRRDRADRDRAAIAADVARLTDPAPLAADRTRAAGTRAAALAEAEDARVARAAADAAERAAIAGRDTAQSARAAAHAELAALDGEATALVRAARPTNGDRLLDRLSVAPGFERALAAALDDDLSAGLDPAADRHWAGAAPRPDDPAPPLATSRLADHITGPEALSRRLAQIFVAEADTGQRLAVGQRLVTLAGVMRRWDGFVARRTGGAAAATLARANRVRALAAVRPAALATAAAADAALAAIDAAVAEARAAAVAARRRLDTAEAAARTAAGAEDRAAAALDRLAALAADLDARAGRAAADLADAEADVVDATDARASLPDGSAVRAQVAALSAAADAARTAAATARADRTAHDRSLVQQRERLAAAGAEARGWQARAGEAARRIADMAGRETALAAEHAALADRPAALAATVATAEPETSRARADADATAAAERAADAALRSAEAAVRTAAEALAQAREARAGTLARAEAHQLRRVEMGRLSGERFECPPPLLPDRAGFDATQVRTPADESQRHERLSAERERLGPVNLVAERELAELQASAAANARERDELSQAVNRLRGAIGTLNREGRERLREAFEAVDRHFRSLFTTLFNGGQAHLALIDSSDPLEAGLEIMAQPPGKRLQSLTLLSGGEQALTAVALIFALFLTNPAPICVLDEVDAPLDDANIERFCDLLDRMAADTDTRYLIVTHNAATMARMHRLFGVTMIEKGVSRLVSVDLGGAPALAAE